jgi:pimeloyl-ACP methyl ester carboxylesterase
MTSDATHATGETTNSFGGVRTVDVDGAALAYREHGEGEPVVFVHGSASDLRTWEQQLPTIGRSYRAIAYSRRYARPNEDIQPDADDQMLPHIDDLVALLRGLDAAPAHLVGHSWGGFICLLTAIRHPQLVRSLVLGEPPVLTLFTSVPPRPTEMLRLLVRRPGTARAILSFGARTYLPAQKAFRRGDDEAAFLKMSHGMLGKEAYERLPEERKQQGRENLNTLRAQVLGAGFPPLSEDDVRGVTAPTRRTESGLPAPTDRRPAAAATERRADRDRGRLAPDARRERARGQRGDPRLHRAHGRRREAGRRRK